MSSSSIAREQALKGWPSASILKEPPATTTDGVILRLTLPPYVSPPFQVPTGTVVFFVDQINKSTQTTIHLDDYQAGKRHMMPRVQLDNAEYVLYNMPAGTVMTLMDYVKSDTPDVADLKGCSTCIDLVGTGRTEATDLKPVGMNDAAAMFFWREVDLKIGAVELFAGPRFVGTRTTLFLSEWASDTIHSLRGWAMNDQTSSIRWYTLQDRQKVTLYSGLDGDENQYNNVKGWGGFKEIVEMENEGFEDTVSSFKWEGVTPMKEIIEPFNISSANTANSFGLSNRSHGQNLTSLPQSIDISLTNTTAQTVTVETSDTSVTSVSSTFSEKVTEGEVVASSTSEWSVSLSYSYTKTQTKSISQTKTVELSVKPQLNAPPYTDWTASIQVTIGDLPKTEFHTKAQRWYKEPITGAVTDPENKNWYKRVEDVTVEMSGGLACRTEVKIEAKSNQSTPAKAT